MGVDSVALNDANTSVAQRTTKLAFAAKARQRRRALCCITEYQCACGRSGSDGEEISSSAWSIPAECLVAMSPSETMPTSECEA